MGATSAVSVLASGLAMLAMGIVIGVVGFLESYSTFLLLSLVLLVAGGYCSAFGFKWTVQEVLDESRESPIINRMNQENQENSG